MNCILLKNKTTPLDEYEEASRQCGYRARFLPILNHRVVNQEQLQRAVRGRLAGLIVTSQRAVEALGQAMDGAGGSDGGGEGVDMDLPVFTVGPATARSIQRRGFRQVLGAEAGNGELLGDQIVEWYEGKEGSLLFLAGDKRRDILPRKLQQAGIPWQEIEVYTTEPRVEFPRQLQALAPTAKDWVVFFSPAGAQDAMQVLLRLAERPKLATIGPTTEAYLREEWRIEPAVVAARPVPEDLVRAMQAYDRD